MNKGAWGLSHCCATVRQFRGDGMLKLKCIRWPDEFRANTDDLLRLDIIAKLSPGDIIITVVFQGMEGGEFHVSPGAAEVILGRLRGGWKLPAGSLRWLLEGIPLDDNVERLSNIVGVKSAN